MSKITPDCVICHHNPAYDASGWCRTCNEAYDAQQEPEPAPEPSPFQQLAWMMTRASTFPAPTHEEPPYRFPF
jgi:hypothetical protein